MRNISILLLAFMLFLLSPLVFGAASVQQQYTQPVYQTASEQSLTNGIQFADNLKLIKLVKEQQTLLIQANKHIMDLYKYLEKKTASG